LDLDRSDEPGQEPRQDHDGDDGDPARVKGAPAPPGGRRGSGWWCHWLVWTLHVVQPDRRRRLGQPCPSPSRERHGRPVVNAARHTLGVTPGTPTATVVRLVGAGRGVGSLRASELGVSAMPTCIFAAHAGPSGAKLDGVTKATFFVGLRPPLTADPILRGPRMTSLSDSCGGGMPGR
jgi:hypothetical protein